MIRTISGNALRLGLAAWVAFAIATALGIDHAFWASMPIWVVAQPWRGVIIERATWRLAGTFVGGAAGLVLLSLPLAPWVVALGMAAFLAAGAALTHLVQGVRSYLPLMSAITAAVVVIPELIDHSSGLDLALDRLACTVIGSICVLLIVGAFTPRADAIGFRAKGIALSACFKRAAQCVLDADASDHEKDQAVAEAVHRGAKLETQARLIAAGARDGYRRMSALDALLAAGLALVEAANSLGRTEEGREAGRVFLMDSRISPPMSGPLLRLSEARDNLAAATKDIQSIMPSGRDMNKISSPRNPTLAMRAALLTACASLAGSCLQFMTGSFIAELTAFSMAIFALVLGSMPFPQSIAPKLAVGVLLGAFAGVVYRIGVQPYVDGWGSLVLTLLPFIALGAVARAVPRTAPYALDANMCFMLGSQAGAAPVPASLALGAGVAMAAGTLAIVGGYMLLPHPGRHLIDKTQRRLTRQVLFLSRSAEHMSRKRWSAIWGREAVTLAIELEQAEELFPRCILEIASKGHDVIDDYKT